MNEQAGARDDRRGGAAEPGGEEESSGSNWWKWLLGCGCAGLLFFVCAGGAGAAYFAYAFTDGVRDLQEGVEVREEVAEERREAVRGGKVAVDLEEPLSGADYEAFVETIEAWKESEPFRDLKTLSEAADSDDSPSVVEQVRAVFAIWKVTASVHELGTYYIEAIEQRGTIGEHYGRLVRLGAVVAAAHEVSTDHRFENPGDPSSEEVAELLYREHERVLEAYGSKLEHLRGGEETFRSLAESGELGAYAVAVLPRESYQPWFERGEEGREELVETFGWAVAAETLTFGNFAYPLDLGTGLPSGSTE